MTEMIATEDWVLPSRTFPAVHSSREYRQRLIDAEQRRPPDRDLATLVPRVVSELESHCGTGYHISGRAHGCHGRFADRALVGIRDESAAATAVTGIPHCRADRRRPAPDGRIPAHRRRHCDARTQADARMDPAGAVAEAEAQVARAGEGTVRLLPRQVKLFADGAIISQLMQMREPYLDDNGEPDLCHHGE